MELDKRVLPTVEWLHPIAMNEKAVTSFLTFLVVLSALASVWYSYRHVVDTRKIRDLQGQVAVINMQRNSINALATDLVVYSQQDPSIDPLLYAIGAKRTNTPTQTPTGR